MNINHSVVLVTGASSGIGAATARAAAGGGARLVLAARREERIRALSSRDPGTPTTRSTLRPGKPMS